MKKHIGFVIKGTFLLIIILCIIAILDVLVTPKDMFYAEYPTTATYHNFYKLDKDSVDILFLGSSHVVSSIDPQVIYDNYGMTSYNLGCAQQSLMTSYYWLKEALQYQTPQVVVLDTYMFFAYQGNYFNSSEPGTRKAFDPMKWGKVKWEAINDICEHDETQSIESYLFPNIRYHDRWEELQRGDFEVFHDGQHLDLKGYSALTDVAGNEEYVPFDSGVDGEAENLFYYTEPYAEKIVELCRANDISLVLIKTPASMETISRYLGTKTFAEKNNIPFWEFNECKIYNECEFDFSNDMSSGGHLNVWGAYKVSDYLGRRLKTEYNVIPSECNEKWEASREYHENVIQDCNLTLISKASDYFNVLSKQKRYSVIIAMNPGPYIFKDMNIKQLLRSLNLKAEINEYNIGYLAVLEEGNVVKEVIGTSISESGVLKDGVTDVLVNCSENCDDNICSVKIQNVEYAKKSNGISIIVYSVDRKKVIDVVKYENGELTRL